MRRVRRAPPRRYTQISVFHNLEKQIHAAFRDCLRARFGVESDFALEQPRQASFGDVAVPVAFQLAKSLKQAPKKVAADLVEAVGAIPGVSAMEVAGNGYINIRFDRGAYAAGLLGGADETAPASGGKVIVEHTNINPNKAAHIGHLRNAVLGDTFARMLRARGNPVEVQNYIDNTGVQVADVVAGFHFLEKKTPADVARLITGGSEDEARFDYVCWDLYARTSQYYNDHEEALEWRGQTLHAIESGTGELAELAHLVADTIVNAHLATMLRLNIQYDVLPRESEILHLHFWAAAFELLKERGAIYFETEGRNAGCWVMPSSAFRGADEANEDSKVIVRSNGTVTYVGKDIAYQLWKFGLLGKDFYYRPMLRYTDGHQVWVSSDEPQPQHAPEFGRGHVVYNVIDVRQSYLQDVVVAGLKALGFDEQAERSIHFSYEMVALSPRCCADLGIELTVEDARRPYIEVSGRKGLGVKADDLMDKLIETAMVEVASRHPEDSPVAQRAVATEIAMGALRYFLLKFTRNTVIAFDFQEALSFEGDHRSARELQQEVTQRAHGDFSGDGALGHRAVFRDDAKRLRPGRFNQLVHEVVGLHAQTFAPGNFDIRAFGVFDGEFDSQLGAAARRKRHHLVGKVNRALGLFIESERFQPRYHDILQIGLADVDHVVHRVAVAESGRVLRLRLVGRDPELVAVGIAHERAVVKVFAQQTEFPELIRDVFAHVRHSAVRAHDDFAVFVCFIRPAESRGRHHPAAGVPAFGLEIDRVPLFQKRERRGPEMQMQDLTFARQHVVLNIQTQHGCKVRVDDGIGHQMRQFRQFASARFDGMQSLRAPAKASGWSL